MSQRDLVYTRWFLFFLSSFPTPTLFPRERIRSIMLPRTYLRHFLCVKNFPSDFLSCAVAELFVEKIELLLIR